ncbi:hypothetical protein BGW39_004563 [Mortierella sp. 14UC]|nr:hypothetical protein BGW39_004563 [Mortierella sp. 14UC]
MANNDIISHLREGPVRLARNAKQEGDTDDMFRSMKEVFSMDSKYFSEIKYLSAQEYFSAEELRLFFVAFEGFINTRRELVKRASAIKELFGEVKKEVDATCKEVQDIVKPHLENPKGDASHLYFLTLRADSSRYKAEFLTYSPLSSPNPVRHEIPWAVETARKEYLAAMGFAPCLDSQDPQYIRTVFHYTIFLHGISQDRQNAIQVATQNIKLEVDYLDELSEADYKEAATLLERWVQCWESWTGLKSPWSIRGARER